MKDKANAPDRKVYYMQIISSCGRLTSMKGVLFDLDGTLVDTLEDIRGALNHVLSLCYCRPLTAQECRLVVGRGLRKALRDALWLSRSAFPEDEMEILYRQLIDYYSQHATEKSVPYDGILPLLEKLQADGIRTGVLSNKADSLVKEIISTLFPSFTFDYVSGLKEGQKPKPDNDAVKDFISLCNGSAGDVTIVGDSEVDWQCALNYRTRAVIVTYGYRSEEELIREGAENLAGSIEEVEKKLYESDRCDD